ncbi:AMP-dependent synthetase/ligase [Sphingorhabdus sp.]|uniref:AMP-dependent synthetase/ligase n=2 Tax=Sphingorhabdus sp. TaxID=1902408 RepID=UPI003BAFF8A6|nr:long-chain fatty acid--CoA ligase [Sphingomonadales bacterium]MBL0022002.1 long-chain fatty acid--CoA ligase [Sphingomonadales bacterium]
MFLDRAALRGERPFLGFKDGGEWRTISWAETARRVAGLAKSLKAMGLAKGDRVMLVSENRPEWCIADLAVMAAGCVTVPTYTTNTERDHQHILDNSQSRAVIVSTAKLAQALMPAVVRSSECEFVIGMEPLKTAQKGQQSFHDWADLVQGTDADVAALTEEMANVGRDDLACIIYTSGTGGAPRGVMLHHGSILCNVDGAAEVLREDFGLGEERFLSFLPLSHAYEHSGGQFLPIGCGAEIYYSEGLEKLASNIEETQPTIMVVVPRLFEVLRARMIKTVEKQGKFPSYLLDKALTIGERDYGGKKRFRDAPMRALLSKTLKPKIRARFGGRMKAMVSGGAPLNPDIGVFFQSLGITLLQGYGQTEAGPVVACNRPRAGIKMDTVGPPMKGVEIKIADDGEILLRGELVMKGYWRNKAETARVIKDGWLHSGDIGHLDEKGRLKITDRKKDIIVNDKGDNVAPQKVEGMLTLQPEILQAMVSGDKRPYIVGLIVPDPEWALEWAREQDIKYNFTELQDNPQFRAAVRAAIDRVNADLSVTEKVRQFEFADEAFTIENGEMTPSMKIRRHVIRERYQARVDGLYKG